MPQPKIGLSMLYCLSKPFSKMIQYLANVETTYIEIVDDGLHALTEKRVATLKEIAKSKGIKYTVHAPFADMNIASPSKPVLKATLKRLEESLSYASGLDAKLWVFHPGSQTGISSFYPGEEWKQNLESIRVLHETAENLGVNLAMENLPQKYGFIMKNAEDFIKFYRETSLNDIGMALDVGHANLEGTTENFLRKLPDKIVHIHLSDNMGMNDQHLGVGYGKIDWQRFAETLKDIAYDKTLMIESVEHVKESFKNLKQLLA
ncbi:MAG: sugar phosphate isomerase/epimerase [Candidatus Bathyarchaeota archaeon]|nr:sugar phosphate isomerase/epimerase [Candidatus Bathyarchaeota archaeon]